MIAVLMGGNSAEREVSLSSGQAVYESLSNNGIECFKFDWQGDNLDDLWAKSFDKAFIVLHGRGGEDGYIQKKLESRNIPYTGSDSKSSSLCMDKASTKSIWKKQELPLSPSVVANIANKVPQITFPLPWAVKPTLEGSSIGISKVINANELDEALGLAWKYDDNAMIEQWIEGDEFTVSVINNKPFPAIKIISDNEFYDYDSKYHSDSTRYICPSGLSDTEEKQLQELALSAFNAMGANSWGRVDFIVGNNFKPYLLEINTVPGMTSHSLVPMAAKAAGLSFDELVVDIINFADN
jgi:D-alanine-D-alanine ligase